MRISQRLHALVVAASTVFLVGCGCSYQVTTQQPIVFGAAGGSGTFAVSARSGCKWNADEDHNAEDWVKVAGGVVDGTGNMTFNVMSDTQQPNVPLPRSGFINIYQDGSNAGPVTKVEIHQR